MRTYYQILGISPDASVEEIQAIIDKKKKKWMARVAEVQKQAEHILSIIEESKAVLLDERKRWDYDQQLEEIKKSSSANHSLPIMLDEPFVEETLQNRADAGDVEAMRELGLKYLQEGRTWLEKAADQGDMIAAEVFAHFLIHSGDKKIGKRWLKTTEKEIERSKDTEMMRKIGEAFLQIGFGEEGWQWMEKVAELGDMETMKYLGNHLLKKGNIRHGKRWLEKAAEAGDVEAMRMLGSYALHLNDRNLPVEKGKKWLRKAAESGDIEAMRILGKHLFCGSAVEVVLHEEEGKKWLKQAAHLGDVEAMKILGENLIVGGTVKKDPEEGTKWLKKAAEHGDVESMKNLGEYLVNGIFLPKDRESGKEWLKKAAEVGNDDAMCELAIQLCLVEDDCQIEGKKWLEQAAIRRQVLAMGLWGYQLLKQGEEEKGMEWLKETYHRMTGGFYSFGRRYGQYILFERGAYSDHEFMSQRINADNGKMALKRDIHLGDIQSMKLLSEVYHKEGDESEAAKWNKLAEIFEEIQKKFQ